MLKPPEIVLPPADSTRHLKALFARLHRQDEAVVKSTSHQDVRRNLMPMFDAMSSCSRIPQLAAKHTEAPTSEEQRRARILARQQRATEAHIRAKERAQLEQVRRQRDPLSFDRRAPATSSTTNDQSLTPRSTRLLKARSTSNRQAQLAVDQPPHRHRSTSIMSASTTLNAEPKRAFGATNTVSLTEHEREKQRLQAQIDELQNKLFAAESTVSEAKVDKVELNKKIKDLEKKQAPLAENNRKLTERNRYLMQEVRKIEQTARETMDSYLSLKDAHERVLSENVRLREQRPNAERATELDRTKQTNMEYCRLIVQLKQQNVDKDRRLEVLVNRLRRFKKSRANTVDLSERNNNESLDDSLKSIDNSAMWASSKSFLFDCAQSSNSSVSLDTIHETSIDADALPRTPSRSQLLNSSMMASPLSPSQNLVTSTPIGWQEREQHYKNQLLQQEVQLVQLTQIVSEREKAMERMEAMRADLTSECTRLRQAASSRQQEVDALQRDLAEQREQYDLLEFQMFEISAMKDDDADDARFDTWKTADSATSTHHSPRSVSSTASDRVQKSVCTSTDDEAFFSQSCSDGESDELSRSEIINRLTALASNKFVNQHERVVIAGAREHLQKLMAASGRTSRLSSATKEIQTTLSDDLESINRKYADAKRKLSDCMALLKDYEQVNRIGEQKMRSLQQDLAATRVEYQQQLADVQAEIGELSQQLASERIYAEQLEGQLEAHSQLVDTLKQQVKIYSGAKQRSGSSSADDEHSSDSTKA